MMEVSIELEMLDDVLKRRINICSLTTAIHEMIASSPGFQIMPLLEVPIGILEVGVAQVSCHRSSTSLYNVVFSFNQDQLPACEGYSEEELFHTNSPWRVVYANIHIGW